MAIADCGIHESREVETEQFVVQLTCLGIDITGTHQQNVTGPQQGCLTTARARPRVAQHAVSRAIWSGVGPLAHMILSADTDA